MSYTQNHKMLLQTFVHEGLLNENKTKELIMKLFGHDEMSLVINEINEKLQPLNMIIKQAQCEITGQMYWIFISTKLDDITRLQTQFSKEQLTFLRIIFSKIITTDDKRIESTKCLNSCTSPDIKLVKADAEAFLNDMVERKWLIYKDGYYYIGVRSITELMPYFRATYVDNLTTCYPCKQVIFYGIRCDNCGTLMHTYCMQHLITASNSKKCPNCHTLLSDISFLNTST